MLTLPSGYTVLVCDADPIANEEIQSYFTVRVTVVFDTVTLGCVFSYTAVT
jgi:hypothetical protein